MNENILSTDLQNYVTNQFCIQPTERSPGAAPGEQTQRHQWDRAPSEQQQLPLSHHSTSPGICSCILSKSWEFDNKNKEKTKRIMNERPLNSILKHAFGV